AGKGKETALHAALNAPNDDMLEFLLQNGAPVDARNEYGRTPLYEVVGTGNLARAERLIQAGADVNIHDTMGGDTPFLNSVSPTRKHHDMMRLLARHGADVKVVDDYGRSALNLASRWLGDKGEFRTKESDEKAAALRQALIDAGALHPDGNRFTAAAARGDLAAVAQMIQDGLPVDTVDETERTVLYLAVSRRHPNLVKYLLQAGARLDFPNGIDDREDKHWGGLAMPCPKCGHIFTTIIRQRQCPQCNHQFDAHEVFGDNVHGLPMFVSWGNTYPPLVSTARLGDPVLLKLLLTAGADPNLGKNKITPLMVACYCGQVEAVRILLAHGADPKIEGKTPDRMGEKVSPIGIAAAGRNAELLNLLWDAGVPVTDRKPTLLVAAAFHNDAEAIRQLTAQGADPAAPDPMTNDTPLDIAAKEGRTAAVVALIAAGAPLDPKDARGYTPLMQAMAAVDDHTRRKRFSSDIQARYLETVRTLLAAGAKVNVKFYDMFPLSLAKSAKCEPLIELLEEATSEGKAGVS
ncbi:MAG TPA: ankyrin repeat domain-containing protein, partial [Candidatus Angelobacter sp.]|nr:ankyrin repeat domain-containing protein [Candidatus Angelobacter sp.]